MRLKKVGILCLIWGMMVLTAGTASGQFEAFMRIDGISGRFRIDARLTDWEQINRMPDPNSVTSSTTRKCGYQEGKVAFQDFSIIKDIDKSSPVLNMASTQGKHFPRIIIELYTTEERTRPFYIIELTTVFVAGITPEKDIDPKLEKVSFKCQKIEWKYGFPQE